MDTGCVNFLCGKRVIKVVKNKPTKKQKYSKDKIRGKKNITLMIWGTVCRILVGYFFFFKITTTYHPLQSHTLFHKNNNARLFYLQFIASWTNNVVDKHSQKFLKEILCRGSRDINVYIISGDLDLWLSRSCFFLEVTCEDDDPSKIVVALLLTRTLIDRLECDSKHSITPAWRMSLTNFRVFEWRFEEI